MSVNNRNEEIFKAVRPLLYVSNFFGLGPYNFNIKEQQRRRNKKPVLALLYQVFVLSAVVASCIISIKCKVFQYYTTRSVARMTSSVLHWLSYTCTSVVCIIFTGIHSNKISKIIKTLSAPGEMFSPSKKFYRNVKICLILELLLMYISILIIGCYFTWIWFLAFNSDVYIIGLFLYYCIITTMEIQFANMVFLLYYRLKALNHTLQTEFVFNLSNILIDKNTEKQNLPMNIWKVIPQRSKSTLDIENCFQVNENTENTSVSRLQIIRKHQQFLRNVADEIMGAYGLQILFDMISTFIGLTVHLYAPLYFLIVEIAQIKISKIKVIHVINANNCGFVLMVFKLVCMCSVCHIAGTETSRTAVLLRSALLTQRLSSPIAAEIQCLLEQVVNRPLCISACGFFNIDYSFLSSFIGVVVTYVVILIQFY